MKYKIPLFISFVLSFFILSGCSGKVNNSVTVQNLTLGTVYLNFRGSVVTAASGASATVSEIPKGSYTYNTTVSAPSGVTSVPTLQGDFKGTLIINAGTHISIVYSSTLVNGAYSVFATVSSSDSQTSLINP